jgi:hypothetical protein
MQYVSDRLFTKVSESYATEGALVGGGLAGLGAALSVPAAEDALRRQFASGAYSPAGAALENARYQGSLAKGEPGARAMAARMKGRAAAAAQPGAARLTDLLENRAMQRSLSQGVEGARAAATRMRVPARGLAALLAGGAGLGLGAASGSLFSE